MPANKTKKNNQNLTQQAYMGIRHMFFYKEIVPGQKIAYRDLAERLDMSPTPVVQALKWLEFQGLVEHVPNRGYYTSAFSLQEVRENFEVRELLELSLLPAIIKQLDQNGIRQLKASLQAHLNAEGGVLFNEKLIKDRDFHLTLASLSKAQVQLQVLGHLFDTLFLKYRGGYFSTVERPQTIEEHQRIFGYVVSRDLKNARKAISDHLSRAKEQVLKNLERIIAERKISGV